MADQDAAEETVRAGMTEAAMRDNVIRLALGGDAGRYEEFCRTLKEEIPAGTAAVLRGSAVTGVRHSDNAPFDADGPCTSDLDLTLVGAEAVAFYRLTGFFIPKIHSRPVSEDDPNIAPDLVPLRGRLMKMVGRPVNIQGTRDWIMFVREHVMGQPYLTLCGKSETA